ncbi:MAG: glutamate 5-kinase [Rubinisphaera brasiliensis]|uniref:Glutamate 5-kinase n=1 Tax=Rubinisphaera brasiliensis (strain ATCC 49424 / DSM 5305 / JCM 21570 / IAM 15109 / NBRC 103401 / IFAM 1448) TaxID=756272 RepID=F0SKH5_RUBBR|nr:glutamate 5-kinase [Rubinisphaera brasiliensis]ADY61956.1 glutamate 5-kinase [Rubinisphaera brasiliensis DSM 5305]MBR9802707.1 glutamate 5-kinase [bacterium]
MSHSVRRELSENARTFVVKVGTNVLSDETNALDTDRIAALAEQVHQLRLAGKQVVLVSSGSIGAGMTLLGLTERPRDLPHLQAAAATGQAHLIGIYDQVFREHGYHAAQLLLTADDFRSRSRYLNIRNTLRTLFEYGCVPIINENDTVSIDEIRSPLSSTAPREADIGLTSRPKPLLRGSKFSDNDQLAAMVTNLLDAPLLIILSVIDGLFDGDPGEAGSKVIPIVEEWDDYLFECVGADRSSRGTGGMQSKLSAVKRAVSVGENVIIANGQTERILERILGGEDVGTAFLASERFLPAWKRWIGYTVNPQGSLIVDDGARKAVVESGTSLLPIGIKEVQGDFDMGEVISIKDAFGREFARGLTNYDSAQTRILMGRRKEEILARSGNMSFLEAVHRDNLVVMN